MKTDIKFFSKKSIVLASMILFFFILSHTLMLIFPRMISTIDAKLQDQLFRLRYAIKGKSRISPFIVHTVLNDATLTKYNLTLLDRKVYADLIDVFNSSGTKFIAFDILFQHQAKELDDNLLVEAAGRYNNVYFPVILYPVDFRDTENHQNKTNTDNLTWHPTVKGKGRPHITGLIVTPFPGLAESAKGLGHVNINSDPDGVTRRVPLVYKYESGYIPSLPFRMICDYLDVSPLNIEIVFGKHILLKGARFRGNNKKNIKIPVNNKGEVRINYIAPWQDSFYEYSAEELLEAQNNPGLLLQLRDEIEHSAIIVSDNSTRNNDTGTGVFDTVYPNSEIHVTVANMILTGEFITEWGIPFSLLAAIILAAVLWFLSCRFMSIFFFLLSLSVFFFYILCACILFISLNILLPVVCLSIGFFLSFAGAGVYRFLIEEQTAEAHKQNAIMSEKMNRQLKQVDKLKTKFIQNITHDLKSPLTPILSLSKELYEQEQEQEKTREFLFTIYRSAGKLSSYVDELLDLSRLDAGLLKCQFEETDLISFLHEIVKTCSLKAEKKEISLKLTASMEEIFLVIDRKKMEKVFINLIENAIKFTGKGGRIELRVSIPIPFESGKYTWNWEIEKPAHIVPVSVKDTGTGIAKEHIPHIFKRFWKPPEESVTQQKGLEKHSEGTGIGLSLVKEYTRLHYGDVTVFSIPGAGTTFTLYLPYMYNYLHPESKESGSMMKSPGIAREENDNEHVQSGKLAPGQKYPPAPILIVDDDETMIQTCKLLLEGSGVTNMTPITDSRRVMSFLDEKDVALIILDLFMPSISGVELLSHIKEEHPEIPVIVVTGMEDIETALHCIRLGAFDYLVKPVDGHQLVMSIKHCIKIEELKAERTVLTTYLADNEKRGSIFKQIITQNSKMIRIFKRIEKIAKSTEHILIRGETGTGKELIAQAIHKASGRKGDLVVVNTAGIDDTLFSDTLFGHIRGAFADAVKDRDGLIKTAANNTIFLDEIGELEMKSQVKLLRFLQTGDYYPLGSDRMEKSEARIIAATNADLEKKQKNGSFRKDLAYRLSSLQIFIPPLKDRKEDIPLLLAYFMKKYAPLFGHTAENISYSPDLLVLLEDYHFPGNVREFENMVKDAVSRMKKNRLPLAFFKEYISTHTEKPITGKEQGENGISYSGEFPTLTEVEEYFINEAMKKAKKNKTNAARFLGITRFALNRKLNKK